MLIVDIEHECRGALRCSAATVVWEENDYPAQHVRFEINDDEDALPDHGNHFLAALFPLALLHRERRIAVEAPLCPMLAEGLVLVHACWKEWAGLSARAPRIESAHQHCRVRRESPRGAMSFLSGGVDSLHLLLRNRRLFRPEEPGYVRDAVFVHGFDIGKRPRAPEHDRADLAFALLQPLADEIGARLIRGYTDLRHLPSAPDFWNLRHSGAAMAGFGHFAVTGPAYVYMAGPNDIANLCPFGLHPAVDPNYSSQRVSIIHDGAGFSRLDKVRELVHWPAALDALRVCPANVGELLNCGECTKCLQTRLELLAAGCDRCGAFSETRMEPELLEERVEIAFPYQATHYRHVLAPLQDRGHDDLCRVIMRKLAQYEDAPASPPNWLRRSPDVSSVGNAEAPQFLEHGLDLAAVDGVA